MMPRLWRPWPTGPPRPLVEDEHESLSHELGGLSLLGEKPGVEGVCQRGAIDQLPILLDSEHVIPRSATADSDASTSTPPSLVSDESTESFPGLPRTPSPVQAVPLPRNQSPKLAAPSPQVQYVKPVDFERPVTQSPAQPATPRPRSDSNRRPPSSPSPSRIQAPSPSLQTSQDPIFEMAALPKRPTIAELLEEKVRLRRELKALQQYRDSQIEETLKQTAVPAPVSMSPTESMPPMDIDAVEYIPQPVSHTYMPPAPIDAVEYIPQPISHTYMAPIPNDAVGYIHQPVSNTYTSPAPNDAVGYIHQPVSNTYMPPAPNAQSWEELGSPFHTPTRYTQELSYFQTTPVQKRTPSPRTPVYARTATRPQRSVSFAERPPYPPAELAYRRSPDISPRSSHAASPLKRVATVARAPDTSTGLALRPCPRSYPVSGYQDWYTISGLEHMNICPSCMSQIGKSRFRDLFLPAVNSTRTRIQCSFSEVWTRLAWIQTIKKGYDNLELLYEITRPTGLTCPGRRLSTQVWHRLVDHETGLNIPKFAACSACVRNLRLLMPPLQQTFRRQTVLQEKICDLAVDSPRFVQYVDLLDAAANECEAKKYAYPDNSKFIDYFYRKCNLRDCRRQRPILGTWHYIGGLPEFTVCEDCFDDVVRPLAAAQKPIARRLAGAPRLLPGSGPSRCREASCQLYSPRMRAKFRDAVLDNDFRMLESAALKRFDAEQRYRDREEELRRVPDVDRGYHWEDELRYNLEQWRMYE